MIFLNNRDLTALGFYTESLSGWMAAPRVQPVFGSTAGRLGVVVGGPQLVAPRQIVVRGYVVPTTLADRETTLAVLEDAVAGRCVLRTADRPSVQTTVRCISVQPLDDSGLGPQLVEPSFKVDLTFVALDGGSEDVVPQGPRLISTTPTAIPIGTLPSRGWLHLYGYTSPVSVLYAAANGSRTSTLTITETLAAEESLALDLGREDVWKVAAAGTRTRVSAVAGTWPALDPLDAAGAQKPTLAVSSGTGVLLARRRWRI